MTKLGNTHGTRACYTKGCRCDRCGIASSNYYQDYIKRNPAYQERGRSLARQYYWGHREKELEEAVAGRKERRELIQTIKTASGCVDCGWNEHPAALDFDHEPGTKSFDVGAVGNRNIERLKEEAAKCDVVCANCHRIREYNRRKHAS